MTSDLERRALYVAAALGVRRLEQRVALELEQVVPRADRRGGDGGRRDLLRRPRGARRPHLRARIVYMLSLFYEF